MKNLKKIREKKGISQTTLAKDLNLVKSTICQYEKGNRYPDIDMLIKLADYFNTSIDYLVDRVNEPIKAATPVNTPAPADEYSDEEKRLVGAYRVLPEGKRLFLLEMIEKFAAEERGSGHGNKWNRG